MCMHIITVFRSLCILLMTVNVYLELATDEIKLRYRYRFFRAAFQEERLVVGPHAAEYLEHLSI